MSDEDIVNMAKMYRLKKWKETKNLTGEEYAKKLIVDYCNKFRLGEEVTNSIIGLYDDIREADLLRGRSVEVGVASTCFIGCRCNGLAYNVNDVVGVFHVNKKDVYSMYRTVRRELDLEVPLLKSSDYVARFCGDMGLGDDVKLLAMEYVDTGEDNGLGNGKNPLGLVAGALYVACKECGVKVTQRDIVEVVGVSEVVLRRRVSELNSLG